MGGYRSFFATLLVKMLQQVTNLHCDAHAQAHRTGLGEEESASFTASADMEVDSTFNEEQLTGSYVNYN